MPQRSQPLVFLHRHTRAALMACCGGVLLIGVAGCDNATSQADRDLVTGIHEVPPSNPSNLDALKKRKDALTKAINDNRGISNASNAQIRGMLAQTELDMANAYIRQADLQDINTSRLSWELGQLGMQIQTSNGVVAGFQASDPKPVKAVIASKITQAQTGTDGNWVPDDKGALPALAKATDEITKLTADIAALNSKADDLAKQRTSALDDADKTTSQAEAEKGSQAVADFTKAADLRKKANELAIQIDLLNAQATPLQQDLAVRQAQQKSLNDAVELLKAQDTRLDEGWAHTNEQTELVRKRIDTTTNGGGASASANADAEKNSVSDKAQLLQKSFDDVKQLRDSATQELNNAVTHFKEAENAATTMVRENSTAKNALANPKDAQGQAFDGMNQALNPNVYKGQRAIAQRTLADVLAAQARTLGRQKSAIELVSKGLTAAGVTAPSSLPDAGAKEQEMGKAYQDAKALYDEAATAQGELAEAAFKDEFNGKEYARIQWMLTLYSESLVPGNEGLLKTAIDARDQLSDMNRLPPNLPAPLQPARTPAKPGTPDTSAPTAPPA